jgi:hypothetical protein
MAVNRRTGRINAQKGKPGSSPKKDTRAKRTFRLDDGVAKRYEAHCILRGLDSNKQLEGILKSYLGASYWVDRSRDAPPQTAGPAGDVQDGTGAAGPGEGAPS